MRVIWTPDYEIGIGVIDQQHRRIVDYINQIYDHEGAGSSRAATEDVLYDLLDYTYSHLAFEEALMEEAGYRDLTFHRQAHKAFTRQVNGLRQRFDNGEAVASELAEMLQGWLLKHIATEDAGYCEVVKRKLLERNPRHYENWVEKSVPQYFN